MVVDKHPQLVVLGGFFYDLGLGHHDFGMTGAVSDLDDKGGDVLTANEAGHQPNAAACFQVHVSDVSGADELVVHENPGALSLGGLLGNFVLCHLNDRVSRCVCNFNVKFRIVVHVCSPLSD